MDRKETTSDALHAAPVLWRYWLLQTVFVPIGVMIVGYFRENGFDLSTASLGKALRDPSTWTNYALFLTGYALLSAWVLWYFFRRPKKS